jgi:hypothetical protein
MLRWDLPIGGRITFLSNQQAIVTFMFSYCGHRYVKPFERDANGAITFTIELPKPQPQTASLAKRLEISKYYMRQLCFPLQRVFLNLVQFSPLIMLVTISTISAFAPRSGDSVSLLSPDWLGRLKQVGR